MVGSLPTPVRHWVYLGVAVTGFSFAGLASLAQSKQEPKVLWGPSICEVVDIGPVGNLIGECNGKRVYINQEDVKTSYILNPGSLTCTAVDDTNSPLRCQKRPFKSPS